MKKIQQFSCLLLRFVPLALRFSCFLPAVLLFGYSSLAQAPVINAVTSSGATVQQFDKFELTIDLTAAYTNPYDFDDIAVSCLFIAPGGRKDTVDGFFMQDYTLNTADGSLSANGTGSFRVRYTPRETGNWSYILSCTSKAGTTTRPAKNFQCTTSVTAGFIRKNNTAYLGFDDGSQYIPVGENMGWQDNNVYKDYSNWVGKLASAKGNFIRVWMPAWGLGLEWKNGSGGYQGLKKYRQDNAFYLDWLLDLCRQKGVYMMLTLDHHGQVSSTVDPNWSDNPYNAVNGGPCANTWDFFSNDSARKLIKNRFRYILARYGYSPTIMSWELFNEVDWTDNFDTYRYLVTSWHAEMTAWLKSKDVNAHLVTTSYARDSNDPATWSLPGIDFTQTHYYVQTPALETVLRSGSRSYRTKYGKPTLNGEFGLGGDASSLAETDPNGIYIHNCLWGSLFGGSMGSAMTWWWDNYVEPQNLYSHFLPLANFASAIALKKDNYTSAPAFITGGGTVDLSISPGAGWGLAPASDFTIDASGNLSPGASQLGQYLYGSSYNTQFRNPPSFSLRYPVAGQFKVVTGATTGTSPAINIYLDGILKLNQPAAGNSTYYINVPVGDHTIKVDNNGTDWIIVSSYVFTNIGVPLNAYMLKSADTSKIAGWILNKNYNWQYVKNNGTPTPVTGSTVTISGVVNGVYNVQWSDCHTGARLNTTTALASNHQLAISCPSVAWDLGLVATLGAVTAINDLPGAGQLLIYPNPVIDNLNIKYGLKQQAEIFFQLFNTLGQRQSILYQGQQLPGQQWLFLSGSRLSALSNGIYFLDCAIGQDHHWEKILVMK